jgi:chromosome partition protein MukE
MNFHDPNFARTDVLLRRGGHIGRGELVLYEFCTQHYDELKDFYTRFECQMVQHPDGFFYLLPRGNLIATRRLSKPCVHLGLFIALKARDPEITRSSGRIPVTQLLQSIETTIPREVLQKTYAPKQREAATDARITEEIQRALRVLAELGFIVLEHDTVRPLEAIARFAELARHDNAPDDGARILLETERGIVFDVSEDITSEGEEDGEQIQN